MPWIHTGNGITAVAAELVLRTCGRIKERKESQIMMCALILNMIDVNMKLAYLEKGAREAAIDLFFE